MAEDSGDKDSSQAFTVIDPDRGAKGLHKGNENEEMNEGKDRKVISELSLDNMHDEAGEEAGESIHLGRRLLFFAVDQGLSWAQGFAKVNEAVSFTTGRPQGAQAGISQAIHTQAAPR